MTGRFLDERERAEVSAMATRWAEEARAVMERMEEDPGQRTRSAAGIGVQSFIVELARISDQPGEVMAGLARAVGVLLSQQSSPMDYWLEFSFHVQSTVQEIIKAMEPPGEHRAS